MSVLSLKKYAELCAKDEGIRKKAKEIGIKDLDGQIAYAKSLGLEISREDFTALAKEAGLDGKIEQSEEDLKKVAGGGTNLASSTAELVAVVTESSAASAANMAAAHAQLHSLSGW
jgi:predicted ribosomally synthesized peptide with nif11-like leader